MGIHLLKEIMVLFKLTEEIFYSLENMLDVDGEQKFKRVALSRFCTIAEHKDRVHSTRVKNGVWYVQMKVHLPRIYCWRSYTKD